MHDVAPLKPIAFQTCDRCSAAAVVHVTLQSGGELTFCKHHHRNHHLALDDVLATSRDADGQPLELSEAF